MNRSLFPQQLLGSLLVLFLAVSPALGNTVSGTSGAVSSRSLIASQVGVEILQQGGNAIDAAVAVGFALAVTYPSAGNVGGGGFFVIKLTNGDVVALDAREKAPLAAHRDMYLDEQGNVNRRLTLSGLTSTGVPGSVAGLLEALDQYGTMSRQQVIAPAIRLAEEGFVLNQDLATDFAQNLRQMQDYPASMAVFSRDGEPYREGDRWLQPDLAETLKRISEQGRDGFYTGTTADLLVAEMQRNGGLITYADLEQYQPVWREPIHGTYRGLDIWSMPPASSGGIVLMQMLNMLEAHDVAASGWGTRETTHRMIEAQKRAYADRAKHLGDADYYPVPIAELVDKDYARQRYADFDAQRAKPSSEIFAGSFPEESTETTHYSVMDSSGNAVAVTTTLNSGYGNRMVVAGAGFLLNNEMGDFTPKANTAGGYGLMGEEANLIEPGKRMLSSMTPTIVTQAGQTRLITGSPGGSTIINTVLHVLVNFIDHRMSVADAVASPRFHHQWLPDSVRYENGAFNEGVLTELEGMGHQQLRPAGFGIGDANSISFDGTTITATSDPRSDGGAAAW
jgi:gamma-glutamyltranspeptidase/glutathione hydrolase